MVSGYEQLVTTIHWNWNCRMSHVFKLKQQNNGLKSLSLAYYSVSSWIQLCSSVHVIAHWTSIVVFLYRFSLDMECRTDAGILNRLRCVDRFWQFVKLNKVRFSSDNIVMCAVMLHCIVVNWTEVIVANINWTSMDVQWTANTPVFYCTGSVQLSITWYNQPRDNVLTRTVMLHSIIM